MKNYYFSAPQILKQKLILFDIFCIINLLLFIRLPAAYDLSDNLYARLISLVPLLLSIFIKMLLLFRKSKIKIYLKKIVLATSLYWLWLFVALFQSLVRGNENYLRTIGNFSVPVIVIIFGASLSIYKSKTVLKNLPILIYTMLVWYILFNFLLLFLDLYKRPDIFIEPRRSVLLSYFGFDIYRVTFPTAVGVNTFGYVAGLIITAGAILWIKSQGLERLYGFLGVLLGMVAVFLVDSRSALVFSFFSIIIAGFSRKAKGVIWLSVFFPLLLVIFLQNLPPSWLLLISRSGMDAITLSNRTVIWEKVLSNFLDFEWLHLIGYGYRGQISSGLMEQYKYLFSNYYQNYTAIPLHNSFLQYFVDTGYFGLIIFIILLHSLFNTIENLYLEEKYLSMIKVMLIFLVVSAGMDAVLNIDSQETFITFIMIISLALIIQTKAKPQQRLLQEEV